MQKGQYDNSFHKSNNINKHLLMNIPDHFQDLTAGDLYEVPASNSNRFYLKKQTQQEVDPSSDSDMGSDIAISHFNELYSPFTYEENFKPIMECWINKKTLNTIYQERYFVLTPTRLCYYTNDNKNELKGCFNLVSLLKYKISVTKQQMEIKIKLSPENYHKEFQNRYILQMEFTSETKLINWFNELSDVIKKLYIKYEVFGKQLLELYPQIPVEALVQMNQKFGYQFNNNYWNRLDVSVPELRAYCSHLDILLLRSKNPVAYFSRFFMRSYYDHVALIIRSQLHEIFVFEATQSRGVSLIDLQTFLKINQEDYEEIAFRKLLVKQSKENDKTGMYKGIDLEKLQKYLNSLLGKKYELSLSKLLIDETEFDVSKQSFYERKKYNGGSCKVIESENKKSAIVENEAQQDLKKRQKTFFCSELIANIYLKFGLIRQGKSKDFWPKDFQENDIKFKQNTFLSPIMNVCFK